MSRLDNYLIKKERARKKEIEGFLKEANKLTVEIHQKPFEMEKEYNTDAKKRNILREEFNAKLKIYDAGYNNLVYLTKKCVDKVVMVLIQLNTILAIAIIVSLVVGFTVAGLSVFLKFYR